MKILVAVKRVVDYAVPIRVKADKARTRHCMGGWGWGEGAGEVGGHGHGGRAAFSNNRVSMRCSAMCAYWAACALATGLLHAC